MPNTHAVFVALFALPLFLGVAAYLGAVVCATIENALESARIRALLTLQAERTFRLTGRTATTAAEVRAWRLALPMPTPVERPKRFLRRAPSVNEAVTVPNAYINVEVV